MKNIVGGSREIIQGFKKDNLPFYFETFKEVYNCNCPQELNRLLLFIQNEISIDRKELHDNLAKKGIKLEL